MIVHNVITVSYILLSHFQIQFFYTGPMLKAVFATEMVILLNYIIIIIIINNARNRGKVCLFQTTENEVFSYLKDDNGKL